MTEKTDMQSILRDAMRVVADSADEIRAWLAWKSRALLSKGV